MNNVHLEKIFALMAKYKSLKSRLGAHFIYLSKLKQREEITKKIFALGSLVNRACKGLTCSK